MQKDAANAHVQWSSNSNFLRPNSKLAAYFTNLNLRTNHVKTYVVNLHVKAKCDGKVIIAGVIL